MADIAVRQRANLIRIVLGATSVHADDRARRAAINAGTAFGARTVAMAASLVTVPVLLGYLGLERYGMWVTATTFAAWVGLGQLGVAPSLLNRLARIGRDQHEERATVVTAAWWLSVVLAAAPLFLVILLDAAGAWPTLFNTQLGPAADDARLLALAMCVGAAASMPLAIPIAILRADQAGYLASAAEVVSTASRLLAIVVVTQFDLGLTWLALAAASTPVLVGVATAARVYGRRVQWPRISKLDRQAIRGILTHGIGFLGMAVAALIISSTDVIVIAQVLGPAAVPIYAVAFSLLVVFVGLEMAVLDSMWPAYAEASARGDGRWIAVAHRRITIGFLAAASTFAIGLVVLGKPVISAWAGAQAVPPTSLLAVFGGIAIAQAVLLPHGRVLSSLGRVRRNTTLSLAGALINLPLSVTLAPVLGVTGVALGTLVAYLVTGPVLIRLARNAIRDVRRDGDAAAGPTDQATETSTIPAADR